MLKNTLMRASLQRLVLAVFVCGALGGCLAGCAQEEASEPEQTAAISDAAGEEGNDPADSNEVSQEAEAAASTLALPEAPATSDPTSLLAAGYSARVCDTGVLTADLDARIAMQREVYGLTDEAAWEAWLAEAGVSAQEYRSETLDTMIRETLANAQALAHGAAVSDAQLDEAFAKLKEGFGDDAFTQALAGVGMTEEAYRETYRAYLNEKALAEALFPASSFEGDADAQAAAQENAYEEWFAEQLETQVFKAE